MQIRRELFEMFFMNRIPRSGFTLEETRSQNAPPTSPVQGQGSFWLETGQQSRPPGEVGPTLPPLGGGSGQESF